MENPTPTFSEGMQAAMSSEPIISEVERIQQRVANSRILLMPNTAQAVLGTVELALQKGLFKMADMDAVITIREEIQKGIIDHNTTVAMAQKQLEEAQIKDAETLQRRLADEREKERQQLIDERILRKRTQDRLAQMEAAMLKAGISMDLNGDGIIGLTTGQVATALTQDEQVQVAELLATTPPSPAPVLEPVLPRAGNAMRLARSLNPAGIDLLAPAFAEPTVNFESPVAEKVQAAKEAFANYVEPQDIVITPAEPIPEVTKTFSQFVEEVEKVSQEETEEEFDEITIYPNLPVTEVEFLDLPKVSEEPSTITPKSFITGGNAPSSKPIISGGNAPNLKAIVSATPSVTAPVLGENDVILKQSNIRIFEEELPQVEEEEEYEEISIPTSSELMALTKAGIQKEGDKLGFELSGTKAEMVKQFHTQTEAFIAQLQEDGEFMSAIDTDEGVEDNGDENNRDGGYF